MRLFCTFLLLSIILSNCKTAVENVSQNDVVVLEERDELLLSKEELPTQNSIKSNKNEDALSAAQESVMESKDQTEKQWGIQTKNIGAQASFCEFMLLKRESDLSPHIRNAKCGDLENSDLTILRGEFVFPKLKKTYKMNIYVFKENSNAEKEIPVNGDFSILGNDFAPIDMAEKKVKAYISSEMLRIYLSSNQKILISTFMVDQGVREIPAQTEQEMLAIGNILVKKLSQG